MPADRVTVTPTAGTVFVENGGQLSSPEVRFYAQGDLLSVGFADDGIHFVLVGNATARSPRPAPGTIGSTSRTSFVLRFEGSNEVRPVGVIATGGVFNHLTGDDASCWVRGARTYEEVWFKGLYDGVDLRFHFADGALKYDLVLGAGADPERIVMRYEGVLDLSLDASTGDLLIGTVLGSLRDSRPVVLQQREGGQGRVDAAFRLLDGSRCGFELPPEVVRGLPMVIDPGLKFSTFLGGVNDDYLACLKPDDQGNSYVGGIAWSTDFPVTPGAYETMCEGISDGYVAKIDPTGSRLLFCTLIGGGLFDVVTDLAVRPDGTILCKGYTLSKNFPTTEDALVRNYNHDEDIFLAILSADGAELLYGSYYGGTLRDSSDGGCLETGQDGSVYIVGYTNSWDIGATSGAFCTTFSAPPPSVYATDVFATKLSPDLRRVEYCTYFGGTGNDYPSAIALDDEGNLVIVGITRSFNDLPVSGGAYQPECGGGEDDGFVARLSADGSNLMGSTYLGGIGGDISSDVCYRSDGAIVVVGWTSSSDFTITPDAFCSTRDRDCDYGFLTILNDALSAVLYSSIFGEDMGVAFFNLAYAPSTEQLYLLGSSNTSKVKAMAGAFEPRWRGSCTYFLMVVDMDEMAITYFSYLGRAIWDLVYGELSAMAISSQGGLFIGITTSSPEYPSTRDAYDNALDSRWDGADAVIMRFEPIPCLVPKAVELLPPLAGDGYVRLRWAPVSTWPVLDGAVLLGYRVYRGTGPGNMAPYAELRWDELELIDTNVTNGVRYHYAVVAVNGAGEGPAARTSALPLGLPSNPRELLATTGDGNVTLSWSCPEDAGGQILWYRVLRGPDASNLTSLAWTDGTSYVDEHVGIGFQYSYGVVPVNELGEGEGATTSIVPIGPPGMLSVLPGDRNATLTWGLGDDDMGPMLRGFRIYRGTSPRVQAMIDVVAPSERRYVDTNLENNRTYYYYISTYTMDGESNPSMQAVTVPFGPPSPPTRLTAVRGDGFVSLSWGRPLYDNGRPVLGYTVWSGPTHTDLRPVATVIGSTTFVQEKLTNGLSYYLAVSATNAGGEGMKCPPVSATPMGVPGSPFGLIVVSTTEGVLLRWQPPTSWGGTDRISFKVNRFSIATLETVTLAEGLSGTEFLDTTAAPHEKYQYNVYAVNIIGHSQQSAIEVHTRATLPGTAVGLRAIPGDGYVELYWSPPADDGGAPVLDYIVLRGLSNSTLLETVRTDGVTDHIDFDVENGLTYYYAIRVVNLVGTGTASGACQARPRSLVVPTAPLNFTIMVREGGIVLSWEKPVGEGFAEVTGYRVLRGTSWDAMTTLAILPVMGTYSDTTAERGRTYYYSVAARTAMGDGAMAAAIPAGLPAEGGDGHLAYVLAAVLVVGIALMLILYTSRSGRWLAGRGGGEEVLTPVESDLAASAVSLGRTHAHLVEEVFVIYRDGRLIASCARKDCSSEDSVFMSGMLIAVQGIVQDGLAPGAQLRSIRSGGSTIHIATSPHLIVAAAVYGEAGEDLDEELEATVRRIEVTYAGVIERWDGDPRSLAGVEEMVSPLIARTADIGRDALVVAKGEPGVAVHSAIDFHQGFVRLKVAVVNGSQELILDAAMEVNYNSELLRLDHIEPRTTKRKGERAVLGNIPPGSRESVAFLFDPQICQGTHLDGNLMYYDPKGAVHRLEMRRRTADVVCPVFFTRRHANTAMLRRLIRESLGQSDLRAFRYSRRLTPGEVLEVGKAALRAEGVQLVREHIEEGPPFYAEVWFYGETKRTGQQMVMRLGVLGKEGLLEFFAASTAMETVTGLLAEFRRELERNMRERFGDEAVVSLEMDEIVRRDLAGRTMLLESDLVEEE